MAVLKYWDGSTWQSIGAGVVWSPGDLKMTMRTTADAGWLMCDGSLKSQATYPDLFEAIGHSGNDGIDPGGGNFRLPDLRRRIPVGKAASGAGSTIGGTGGSNDAVVVSHAHTQNAHSHTQNEHSHSTATDGTHTHGTSGFNNWVVERGQVENQRIPDSGSTSNGVYVTYTSFVPNGSSTHGHTVNGQTAVNQNAQPTILGAGVSGSDANMQAYQVVNYMIHI